jgi:hypothetical protein
MTPVNSNDFLCRWPERETAAESHMSGAPEYEKEIYQDDEEGLFNTPLTRQQSRGV